MSARVDVIIILGNSPPVDDEGNPTDEVIRRVEEAVALYHAGVATNIITAGGNTHGDFYESEVMADLAVELGVPRECILQERKSRSTRENAMYCVAIMKEQGWRTCVLVSRPQHLSRGRRLFEEEFVGAFRPVRTRACPVPDGWLYGLNSHLYEFFANCEEKIGL